MTRAYSPSKKAVAVVMAVVILLMSASLGFSALAAGVANTGDGSNKASLTFSPQGGGIIYYKAGAMNSRTTSKFTRTFPVGTSVTLTATEKTDGEVFLYWYNLYTDRIISYEKVVSFTLTCKTQIYAVFTLPLEGYHYVVYLNYAGSILLSGDYELASVVAPPDDPVVPGFTFNSWDMSIADVANTATTAIVRPRYTLNSGNYTVAFTNSDNVYGAGTYNNYDTVKISADAKNGSGESFSCWKDSNNKVVSYEKDYNFRINYSETFTAVYGETVTPEPVIRISNVVTDSANDRLTFFSERSIPSGYKLLQHGIILTASQTVELALPSVTLGDSAQVKRGTGVSNETCGTYSLTKTAAGSGTIYYAKAYAICENSAGTQLVFYSEVKQASI